MSPKFLIALQYWNGDRDAALRLVKFLADLEPKMCQLADFLLVYRFDAKPPDQVMLDLSRKFKSYTYKSPGRATGWPDGCNGLWEGTMDWFYCMAVDKKIPAYKAIFCCEADGGPCRPDWIAAMSAEWDRVNEEKKVCVAGPLVKEPAEHINGNCLLSGNLNFLKWATRGPYRVHPRGGWDFVLYREFKKMGVADIPQMRSYYNSKTFSVEQYEKMREENLIWVHGCKDSSLIDFGRLYLLEGKNAPVL
jgi:hypothetical protein